MRILFRLIVVAIVALGVALLLVDRGRYGGDSHRELSPAERDAKAVEAAHRLEAEAKRNLVEHADGRHCLNPATGTHTGIVAFVTAKLHDPASFEHLGTEITPVNLKGQHLLKMRYRARNESGGTYEASETFVVQNSDCSYER
jgi:hypothetical protein